MFVNEPLCTLAKWLLLRLALLQNVVISDMDRSNSIRAEKIWGRGGLMFVTEIINKVALKLS